MSHTVDGPGGRVWWEKSGNTSWVQCPTCADWFHVSEGVLAAADTPMHCPHCHDEFTADKAARVVKPS